MMKKDISYELANYILVILGSIMAFAMLLQGI